ncbi:MAG: FAM83 family protein [Alphaproteobacteria bacterium]|nr:FAM83 family protein [Alphaproteobacteria bacterium]
MLKKIKPTQFILWIFVLSFYTLTAAFAFIEPDTFIIYPEHEGQSARDLIIKEIDQAKECIQMSAYQMRDAQVADALIKCAKRGVKVELILEENPYQHAFNQDNSQEVILPRLMEAGITVHSRPQYLKDLYPKGHYHARYIIIDSKRFLLTTGNFDECTFDHCIDFALCFNRDAHPIEFDAIQSLFINDTHNNSQSFAVPSGVIIGPDQQREKIISFLNTATKNIKLYQQYFNDPAILEIIEKLIKEKGVKVELLMMPYPTGYASDPNALAQDHLKELGGDVRLILDRYAHARAIIIDDQSALVGTAQLSAPSLDHNREVSLIIKGAVVSQLVAQFQRDQKSAASLEEGRTEALKRNIDWNTFRRPVK